MAFSLMMTACGQGEWEPDPYDLDFDIPRSESFARSLSAYGLYEGPLSALQPTDRAHLYELSSELFTDYAHKQRLVMVPEGSAATRTGDTTLEFPEGTILAKTFFYPLDMRDPAGSIRGIETRLLVKTAGDWNVATYLWDDQQVDATLLLEGTTTEMSWVDEAGESWSTNYVVPHEGECVTCHQLDGDAAFIGPTLRNLNRMVIRDGNEVDQIEYLRAEGVLGNEDWGSAPAIPNYKDEDQSLESRARAYLDINCAHCHRPEAWEQASKRDLDFRYSTPLDQTGIADKTRELKRQLETGEMPYLGTTLEHEAGVRLVLDYVESL